MELESTYEMIDNMSDPKYFILITWRKNLLRYSRQRKTNEDYDEDDNDYEIEILIDLLLDAASAIDEINTHHDDN